MDNPARVERRQGQGMPQVCMTGVMLVTVEKMTSISTIARGNVSDNSNQERKAYILTGHQAELTNMDQPSMDIVSANAWEDVTKEPWRDKVDRANKKGHTQFTLGMASRNVPRPRRTGMRRPCPGPSTPLIRTP
jgi:hypothetical protein